MWAILSRCWRVDWFHHVSALFCNTTLLGKKLETCTFISVLYTITCSASQIPFLFWVSLLSPVSSANTKTITSNTDTLDSSQHLIHNLTCWQGLPCWGVIVPNVPKGRLWLKKYMQLSESTIMCLCCSTKSSFPLLTDGAAGWRSRHETSRQSSPVSHSSDTSDHTNIKQVGQPHSCTNRRNSICCKVVQPADVIIKAQWMCTHKHK